MEFVLNQNFKEAVRYFKFWVCCPAITFMWLNCKLNHDYCRVYL